MLYKTTWLHNNTPCGFSSTLLSCSFAQSQTTPEKRQERDSSSRLRQKKNDQQICFHLQRIYMCCQLFIFAICANLRVSVSREGPPSMWILVACVVFTRYSCVRIQHFWDMNVFLRVTTLCVDSCLAVCVCVVWSSASRYLHFVSVNYTLCRFSSVDEYAYRIPNPYATLVHQGKGTEDPR